MSRRAGVYNAFWASMGGGERHGGRLAQVLAEDGWAVDLISPIRVSHDLLADRLSLDLSGCRVRVVPDRGEEPLAEATGEYDLFVNASYMSRLRPRAKTNIYLCYFPTPFDHDLSPVHRWLIRRVGPYARRYAAGFTHGLGWYPPDRGRLRSAAWTNGDGLLAIPPGVECTVSAEFARPGRPEPVTLSIEHEDGRLVDRFEVTGEFRRRTVVAGGPGGAVLRLRSATFVPGGGDNRTLGVAVSRLRVGLRPRPSQWLGYRFPWLLRDPGNLDFLAGYDLVLANSEYTRGWINRLWQVDAPVLFPPIRRPPWPPAAGRAPVIVTVGRFFAPGYGHSKRQLEMVRFFGRLSRGGRLPGWRLCVIGGCEPAQRPYLEQVRAAARGLPVEVVANAPRRLVEERFATSSLFWSATGYGEHPDRRPWTFEHFGMTTVEAMSGGCVPIVIDRAGQREIVRDGVDGYRWRTPAQLLARTVQVAGDEPLRRRLAGAAVARAAEFSDDAFAERWRAIAVDLGLPAP